MNRSAREHLTKAEEHFAKGERSYHKAAEEIVAAQEADSTLSNGEIGKVFGRSATWVRDIVRWHTTSLPDAPIAWTRGTHATKAEIEKGVEKVLRTAPLEQVERMVESLPAARRQAVAAAAGHAYSKARRDYDDEVSRRTPAQRAEREAAAEEMLQPMREAVAGFSGLGIVGHLEQATEDLAELNEQGSITKRTLRQIEQAHEAWCTELDVARLHLGLEVA